MDTDHWETFLISNEAWILPLFCKKMDFWAKKKIEKIPGAGFEPGTFQLWALPQDHYTKRTCLKIGQRTMLHEVHMPFRHLTRAAGISNVQIFKSLRLARKCMLRVGNPNSFDMCSECSKVYVTSFFLVFGNFFFQERQNCLT